MRILEKLDLGKLEGFVVFKIVERMNKGCSALVNSFCTTVLGVTVEVLCEAYVSALLGLGA